MPSIAENREKWTHHEWRRGGHEWSPDGTESGTDLLWWHSILPRLHAHLPADRLLEIAPGFGRWTSYLLAHCRTLVAVDVTERCVETCRSRFGGRPGVQFHLNDGSSLPMVGDSTIDLAFSFDSLVHVELGQIQAYVLELARTLAPGGAAFVHHSNLGAYARHPSGDLPPWVTKPHWRAASVSAARLRDCCRAAGLHCVTQEVINWIGRGRHADRFRLPGQAIPLTDCITVARKPGPGVRCEPTRVRLNRRFVDEWRELRVLAQMYATRPCAPSSGNGDCGTASVRERLRERSATARAFAAEQWAAYRCRRQEPVARAVRAGRCPDCGARLSGTAQPLCTACNIRLMLT